MFYNHRNKRYYSTNHTPTNKLLINSKNNNLIFDDNKSILFISLNDPIPEIIKNLNKGYYSFNFYPLYKILLKRIFLNEDNKNLDLCKVH